MRLTPEQVRAIKEAAALAFGPTAIVRLFGSRVHDHLRGGDIDLHVEVDPLADEWKARAVFEDAFFERAEPRKVDVVISERGVPPGAFERIAYRDGIVL